MRSTRTREIALSDYPPIPSQGKNLNVLMNDCAALPTGDRSPLGSFHVRFLVGKRLTVNVFRQRMNQLFQGGGDIWRGIAKHSLWAIAQHSLWEIAKHSHSRDRIQCSPRFLLKGNF
ncbi:hypothetical protein [Cylindrospermopsis sp. CR12]|uniref:hypothetical protein n=1 Tax=Cylindrospermopsis sp. CR12 TaxID=1747196 RepID=UPI001F2179C7|nr:hypothetical protein [Cylindrospermopsis sp. CR12]